MRKNYLIKQSIRFRYWSRKRYAMFFSVGRQVTIGCLAKGILEVALKKQKTMTLQLMSVQPEKEDVQADEASGGRMQELFLLLAGLLQPQTVVNTPCGAGERIKLIDKIIVRTDGTRLRLKNLPCAICFCVRTKRKKYVDGNQESGFKW